MPLKNKDSTSHQELHTYITSNEVWASVEHSTRSGEQEVATRKTALTHVVFETYFREAVRPTWRIFYQDADWEIESILPDETRTFCKIEAVQREPWRDDYIVSETQGFWTDPSGNYWVVTQRGTMETQPEFGNLTWTATTGETWTVT